MSTNLPRITQKIFAQNAAEDDLLQFGSVLSGSATPSTSIAETQTSAYQTGWRSAVISDRNYPTLGEMNAVQQVPTQQLAYLFQKGIAEWDASTTYFANVSYCQVNGVLYQSVSDNNIGNNPTTDNGTNWIIADLSNKITNCILSAQNGVIEYSGKSITLKAGLKGLIPNKRNADKSLNNIEYTNAEDVTNEYTSLAANQFYTLFAYGENHDYDPLPIATWLSGQYYEQDTEPVTPASSVYAIWFDTYNNIFKTTENGSSWREQEMFKIATILTDDSGNIKSADVLQPVSLAKEQDIDGRWINKNLNIISSSTDFSNNKEVNYDISSYLPNDNNVYEILAVCVGQTASTNGKADVRLSSDMALLLPVGATAGANIIFAGNCIIPVRKRNLTLSNETANNCSVSILRLTGYRKVR